MDKDSSLIQLAGALAELKLCKNRVRLSHKFSVRIGPDCMKGIELIYGINIDVCRWSDSFGYSCHFDS